ncbi:MAG: hypothetical protein ACLPH3_19635 [Terracidiphilus sp.]
MHDSFRHREFTLQGHLPHGLSSAKALLASAFLTANLLAAQSQSAQPVPPAQTAPAAPQPLPHRQIHSTAAHPASAQTAPATPPAPAWPINDKPALATITWNQNELRIDAANSSLQQILSDVATATGSSLEGDSKDERVFGSFGPAPARDVLAQLLQGSGYNIVMVGDQGQGVPRQIILSAKNTNKAPQGVTRSTAEDNEDDAADYPQYDPQPQQAPQPVQPVRPGLIPEGSGPIRNGQPLPPQQPQTQPQPGQQPNAPPNE